MTAAVIVVDSGNPVLTCKHCGEMIQAMEWCWVHLSSGWADCGVSQVGGIRPDQLTSDHRLFDLKDAFIATEEAKNVCLWIDQEIVSDGRTTKAEPQDSPKTPGGSDAP